MLLLDSKFVVYFCDYPVSHKRGTNEGRQGFASSSDVSPCKAVKVEALRPCLGASKVEPGFLLFRPGPDQLRIQRPEHDFTIYNG